MRIAILLPGGVGADGVHGVIPAVLSLVERLAARHDVLILATDQVGTPERYRLRGAGVVCLGGRRSRPLGRLRVAASALAELRRFRPGVIHALWLGPGSSMAVLAGWILRVPVVATVGGGELVAIRRIGYGGALTWQGRFHARFALRFAAAVTAGSAYALGLVVPSRPDARWLPLGAGRMPEPPRMEDEGVAPGPLRLLVVASVNRVKGPEVILEAVDRIRRESKMDVQLDWVGEDTLEGEAAALAQAMGVGDVISFRGFEAHAHVLERMASADLLVQGSRHEGQGVAVLEAAMCGVPTVGTAVGLAAELAALEPPAAIAVPIADPAALANAIVTLAADAPRRRAVGAAARAWALAHDAGWTAASFEAVYREVAGRH